MILNNAQKIYIGSREVSEILVASVLIYTANFTPLPFMTLTTQGEDQSIAVVVNYDFYDCRTADPNKPIVVPTGVYAAGQVHELGTGTARTQESWGPYDWPMRYRMYVSANTIWFAAERLSFGTWESSNPPGYTVFWYTPFENFGTTLIPNLCLSET